MQIRSDQGNEVDSSLMREICRSYGIDKVRTTAYKSSTNGAVERFHRSLNSMLGKVVSDSQRDWVERLPYVMAAYRASRHEATGFSPNLLVFGREVRAPIDLVFGSPDDSPPTNRAEFVERQESLYREAYSLMQRYLGEQAQRRKKGYDMRVRPAFFTVGTWVWYYSPRRYVGRSPK